MNVLKMHEKKVQDWFDETEVKVNTPASEVDVGVWNESWFSS